MAEKRGPNPTVLIVGISPDLTAALQEVVSLAHCTPVAVDDFNSMGALQSPPAAIVAQIRAALPIESVDFVLAHWPYATRPKVVALVSTDEDVAEAERLACEVVLREPWQVRGLYETLTRVARSCGGRNVIRPGHQGKSCA